MTDASPLLAAVLVAWLTALCAAGGAVYAVWWVLARHGRTLLLLPLAVPVCVWLWLGDRARAGHHYP
ncbi:MAG: hypothetical protein KJ056_10495 [Acidimicrobiia bacterium]|nr:hypothetical protein [Acidimicrobiia bacterium]